MLDFARAPRVFVSPETFERLAADNDLLRLERTADGRVIVLPPTGLDTADLCNELNRQLANWNHRTRLGKAFGSNAGFTLTNGAVRSPDASWVEANRWERLPAKERARFGRLDPDFAVELVSKSDSMSDVRNKAREYAACNVRLTWIIDPASRIVEIYRPGVEPQFVIGAESISAAPELPGFVLDLRPIFDP